MAPDVPSAVWVDINLPLGETPEYHFERLCRTWTGPLRRVATLIEHAKRAECTPCYKCAVDENGRPKP